MARRGAAAPRRSGIFPSMPVAPCREEDAGVRPPRRRRPHNPSIRSGCIPCAMAYFPHATVRIPEAMRRREFGYRDCIGRRGIRRPARRPAPYHRLPPPNTSRGGGFSRGWSFSIPKGWYPASSQRRYIARRDGRSRRRSAVPTLCPRDDRGRQRGVARPTRRAAGFSLGRPTFPPIATVSISAAMRRRLFPRATTGVDSAAPAVSYGRGVGLRRGRYTSLPHHAAKNKSFTIQGNAGLGTGARLRIRTVSKNIKNQQPKTQLKLRCPSKKYRSQPWGF